MLEPVRSSSSDGCTRGGPPRPCWTTCASSWAMRARPSLDASSYRSRPKTTSVPTVYARAPRRRARVAAAGPAWTRTAAKSTPNALSIAPRVSGRRGFPPSRGRRPSAPEGTARAASGAPIAEADRSPVPVPTATCAIAVASASSPLWPSCGSDARCCAAEGRSFRVFARPDRGDRRRSDGGRARGTGHGRWRNVRRLRSDLCRRPRPPLGPGRDLLHGRTIRREAFDMAKWNVGDLPDQNGRTVFITGANSGLGLRSAEALAARARRCCSGAATRRRRPSPSMR